VKVQSDLLPFTRQYALSRHLREGAGVKDFHVLRHKCGRQFLTLHCLNCGFEKAIFSGSRDRTCPACSYEIYRQQRKKFEPILKKCRNLKMVTLTIKPVPKQSPEFVRQIFGYLARLLHRKKYAKSWKGILGVIECKKTDKGLFYYHLHLLINGNFVLQSQLSRDWKEISGFPIVWIEAVRSPIRAIRYVLKYLMKGSKGFTKNDVEDFKASMKHVRFVHTYGGFYGENYLKAPHVYYPCPVCGSLRCWVVVEFCDTVDLFENVPYGAVS
jgi:hypothetical protein